MNANPRGLALIVEIEEYENNGEKMRIGSHVSENIYFIYPRAEHIKSPAKRDFRYVKPVFKFCVKA